MPRQRQNKEKTLTPSKGPSKDRNATDRLFFDPGVPYTVTVEAKGKKTIIASGTTQAEAGKFCALYVRVRAEADVNLPPVEAPE